jgi:hypothetical protein
MRAGPALAAARFFKKTNNTLWRQSPPERIVSQFLGFKNPKILIQYFISLHGAAK